MQQLKVVRQEQALWAMECGFKLHDTMIYKKQNPIPLTHRRYEQSFEYMFIFSKNIPKTFYPLMDKCKYSGTEKFGKTSKEYMSITGHNRFEGTIKEFKQRVNIWEYLVGSTQSIKNKVPAPFPLQQLLRVLICQLML